MMTYRQALKDKTFLVLTTGSDYLKYITGYGQEGK